MAGYYLVITWLTPVHYLVNTWLTPVPKLSPIYFSFPNAITKACLCHAYIKKTAILADICGEAQDLINQN